MNMRNLVFLFILAFLSAGTIQYFVLGQWLGWSKSHATFEPCVVVSGADQLTSPLQREVDFVDNALDANAETTIIDNTWGRLTFSTEGASLEQLFIKRSIGSLSHTLSTIYPTITEKEQKFFLLALQEKTPYFYNLTSHKKEGEKEVLTYDATTPTCSITKTFYVDNRLPCIDVSIKIVPQDNHEVQARLFFAAPYMTDVNDSTIQLDIGTHLPTDIVSSIVVNNQESFCKTTQKDLNEMSAWYKPSLFGADSRYIIHSLIGDPNHFVQRAYYRLGGARGLVSIVEGPIIKDPTEWKLSFYVGTKESAVVEQVDIRLEKSFEYAGLLAPISKILLKILNFLFEYVKNYGLAIILLTLIIKLVFLPFTFKSDSSAKSRAEMQKKLAYLQQRYKDEPHRLAQERAELIKKYGMPGIGGCLPNLLQVPIFFALSRILHNSIELYKAPMLWISDLSAKDPYYILPALVFVSMIAQAGTVDSQQRLSMIIMAMIFGAITSNFAAGLGLYLFISTILTVAQGFISRVYQNAR